MDLQPITIVSRLGETVGYINDHVAYFDLPNAEGEPSIRHYLLLDRGVKLMFEPWHWKNTWYLDMVDIRRIAVKRIELFDLYIDLIIEEGGPTYRTLDLDDLSAAIASGDIDQQTLCGMLNNLQLFLDDHLHKGKDFPPTSIRPFLS